MPYNIKYTKQLAKKEIKEQRNITKEEFIMILVGKRERILSFQGLRNKVSFDFICLKVAGILDVLTSFRRRFQIL